MDIWLRFRARRRSCGSLGRIEIRSSSWLSQFIMLRVKSRLPLKRRILFAIKPEEPTTTNRPWGEPPAAVGLGTAVVPAAASANGPFWSLLGSSFTSGLLRLVVG